MFPPLVESEACYTRVLATLTPTCLLSHFGPYLQNVPALGIMLFFLDFLWVLSSGHPLGSPCCLYFLRDD